MRVKFFSLIGALAVLLTPTTAFGQLLTEAVNRVSRGQLNSNFVGGSGVFMLVNLAMFFINRVSTLIYIAGVYVLVRSGIKMINSQDDDKLSKAKRTMSASLVAIMLAFLTPRFIDAIYGGITVGNPGAIGGTIIEGNAAVGATVLSVEILGIINWVLVLVVPLAIAVIVASCLQAVACFGKEDDVQKIRQSVMGVAGGLLLFILAGAIKVGLGLRNGEAMGRPDAGALIVRVSLVVSQALYFLGYIATAVIVYAGVLMMLNMGNEEEFKKSRTLIVRALMGLAIVFVSVMIIRIVKGMIVG